MAEDVEQGFSVQPREFTMGPSEKETVEVEAALDTEVYEFYNRYTSAFEERPGDIVADLLKEDAREKSEKLREMNDASWLLEPKEEDNE